MVIYTEMIKKFPKDDKLYEALGLIEQLNNNEETSIDYYNKGLELNANSDSIKQKLASLYRQIGQIEKANAIVSCVYLAVKVSCASSKLIVPPSDLDGAVEKPANITSSSNALSDDSSSNISACSFSYRSYSRPNSALSPGSSSLANCALEIAIF